MVKDLTDHVLIDGSFVSEESEPDDVDIVLGLKPGSARAIMTGQFGGDPGALFALLDGQFSDQVEGHQSIHGFADDIGGPKYEAIRRVFQRSSRSGEPDRKGILRINLP